MVEKRFEIADILYRKPINTKLWSCAHGTALFRDIMPDRAIRISHHGTSSLFLEDGKVSKDGECLIYPSEKMRDWNKFAWEKGIILKSGVDNFCIFDSWANDEYTEFNAKYVTDTFSNEVCETSKWTKENNPTAVKQYISKIEEIKGGKLNFSTLGIEPNPPFKDGDIVHIHSQYLCLCINTNRLGGISIFKECKQGVYEFYPVVIEIPTEYLIEATVRLHVRKLGKTRLATEEEKQQFFCSLGK